MMRKITSLPSPITARQERILSVVVAWHIQSGNSAGSADLRAEFSLPWSSATIRNEMSMLQKIGFLSQPHTSAGRVPTQTAYRYYLDRLFDPPRPPDGIERAFTDALDEEPDAGTAVARISQTLNEMTQCTGFALGPSPAQLVIRHLHLIGLAARRALALMVLERGTVVETPVPIHHDVQRGALERASNYLTIRFRGRSLEQARDAIRDDIAGNRLPGDTDERLACALMWSALGAQRMDRPFAVDLADGPIPTASEDIAEAVADWMKEADGLRAEALRRTSSLETVDAALGSELRLPPDSVAVVSGAYGVHGGMGGSIGVVGPINMPYGKAYAAVEAAAHVLDRYFNPRPLVTT